MKILDELNMRFGGIKFSSSTDLGIDGNDDQSAYPQGVTAMSVYGATWPIDGNLLTINFLTTRFSQILIDHSGTTAYVRCVVGNGPALGFWGPLIPESWIDVTTFSNGWENYGSVYSPTSYRKDKGGVVRLRGLIRNGTVNGTAFVLPVGYRPLERLIMPSVTSPGSFGSVRIYESGLVVPYTPSSTSWVSLDGIVFQAEQ